MSSGIFNVKYSEYFRISYWDSCNYKAKIIGPLPRGYRSVVICSLVIVYELIAACIHTYIKAEFQTVIHLCFAKFSRHQPTLSFTCGFAWKEWCMNAQDTQNKNYAFKFQIQKDTFLLVTHSVGKVKVVTWNIYCKNNCIV